MERRIEKDFVDIGPSSKRATCLVCLSDIDIKRLSFGKHGNNKSGFDLCGSCRSLLHKRLHEEGIK